MNKTMKKMLAITTIAVMLLSMLALTSCGGSLEMQISDDNAMTVTADNASVDGSVTSGGLTVEENSVISIDSALEKGTITIEFFRVEGIDDTVALPDFEGQEAEFTAIVGVGDSSEGSGFADGTFYVRATVNEKATGTVEIKVN